MAPADGKSHQLPSSMVQKEFGEINVKVEGDKAHIAYTLLMEPSGKDAEGWQTGVALDASVSMKWAYGKKMEGTVPEKVREEYREKGWLTAQTADGVSAKCLKKEALDDAVERGFLRYGENVMEKLAREFTSYLAKSLDSRGKTNVIYWACGDGTQYEVLGEFTSEECENLVLQGPQKTHFGKGTMLIPALCYFLDIFKNASQSMAIFLTDGVLEDFEVVKEYTTKIAKEIEKEQRKLIKCVLIGVGDDVSVEQLEALDDLDTGTEIDIWDHKIAKEMRTLLEIFAEVVSEHQSVAPYATVYDDKGNIVKMFTDGLPAKGAFDMPASSKFFQLEVGEQMITQNVVIP